MVISRTPLRVSFAGGGSDLPRFCDHEEGAVVSATIASSVYVIVSDRFEGGVRASYSETETVDTVAAVRHDLIREALLSAGPFLGGVEVVTIADVPARGSGLGSSSAVAVGALNALYAHRGVARTPTELAAEACRIELGTLSKPIGRQDQYACALGGLNLLRFGEGGVVRADRIVLTDENWRRLEARLLMFWTGRSRAADEVLGRLAVDSAEVRDVVRSLRDLALALFDDLRRGDPDILGEYLDEGWQLKRRLDGVSFFEADAWYARARAAGAEGGKLLGAGGGGFLLFCAPPERHPAIREALAPLPELPVSLEHGGSRITYVA